MSTKTLQDVDAEILKIAQITGIQLHDDDQVRSVTSYIETLLKYPKNTIIAKLTDTYIHDLYQY